MTQMAAVDGAWVTLGVGRKSQGPLGCRAYCSCQARRLKLRATVLSVTEAVSGLRPEAWERLSGRCSEVMITE